MTLFVNKSPSAIINGEQYTQKQQCAHVIHGYNNTRHKPALIYCDQVMIKSVHQK